MTRKDPLAFWRRLRVYKPAFMFINLGTKDGFHKANFIQFILDISDLQKSSLGRIDMKEMNSWIEIDKKAANQMVRALDGKKFKGRKRS